MAGYGLPGDGGRFVRYAVVMRYPDGGGLDARCRAPAAPATRSWSSDNLNTHISRAMAELIAARDWLTVCQLPPYARELNPAEQAWSRLKRSLASLAKRNLPELTALAKTRLRSCSVGW